MITSSPVRGTGSCADAGPGRGHRENRLSYPNPWGLCGKSAFENADNRAASDAPTARAVGEFKRAFPKYVMDPHTAFLTSCLREQSGKRQSWYAPC